MTPEALRRLTLVHGIVAWLDALLLIVVAIQLLRQNESDKPWWNIWGFGSPSTPCPPNPWFRPLAAAASLGAMAAFASGMALELHYRVHLRQRLFIASKTLGWLFERKMHLSFGVLAFASIGLIALLLTRKDPRFFPSMRSAYLLATAFALAASILSLIVRMSFRAS